MHTKPTNICLDSSEEFYVTLLGPSISSLMHNGNMSVVVPNRTFSPRWWINAL